MSVHLGIKMTIWVLSSKGRWSRSQLDHIWLNKHSVGILHLSFEGMNLSQLLITGVMDFMVKVTNNIVPKVNTFLNHNL